MAGVVVDGTDALAVYEVVKEAAERARRGEGPTLIEARTYRLTAHSSDDNDRTYRGREEVELWKAKEPIPRFRQYLIDNKVANEEELGEIKARIDREVNDATDYAEAQPEPAAEDAILHVYATAEERARWQ
jgi:2-oxoisovalerate dehydrogenase E1 component alpha subunit